MAGLYQDLIKRRLPHIIGAYLAVGWGVLEFVDWLIGRYGIPTELADGSLVLWIAMLPTVGMVAYFHGAPGQQEWRGVEKVGVSVNLVVAGALVGITLARGGLLGAGQAITGVGPQPTRIAVLYFGDESEGQSLDHIASTFTGALIDELSMVGALDVIPRSAVQPYRDASVGLDSLVRAFNVGTLVEGSISGSREGLMLSVSLIDPASQTTIESFSLEGTLERWEDLRNELAAEVALRLRSRLGVEIQLRERQARSESDEALALTEQAESAREDSDILKTAGDSAAAVRALVRADSLLALAESIDPSWNEPTVLRGWAAWDRAALLSSTADSYDQGVLREGLGHAERALERTPGDALALELRGSLRFYMSQAREVTDPTRLRRQAEHDLTAAVAADPFRARAWANLSELQRLSTRFAEAQRSAERALEADPFLSQARVIIFRLYSTSLDLAQVEESVRWCREGRRRFPDHEWFVSCSLFLLALPGGPVPTVELSWALLDTMRQLNPPQSREQRSVIGETWVAAALARVGLPDSAKAVARRARGRAPASIAPWIDYYVANVHLLLDERDAALDLLAAFLDAIPQRKEYIASDWMFEELWEEPRFKALVGTDR